MPTLVKAGSLVTPGGPQGPAGPTTVSADAGNVAVLGSDAKIYVPDPTPTIWNVRLRSFNAIGNPNFEIDQRNVGNLVASPSNNVGIVDRWFNNKAGTMAVNARQVLMAVGDAVVPGTSFCISRAAYRMLLATQQTTLGASDTLGVFTTIEGPQFRELQYDVHSFSLLVRSGVAGLKFAVTIRDVPATKSLSKLCTAGAQDAWTLVAFPNLPVFPSGNFSTSPGVAGYQVVISLASGSSLIPSANDIWQTGSSFAGAVGMDNWCSKPVNSYFDIAFCQHEPGPVCSTLMDKPFSQNLDECLRYYQKSYDYDVAPGTVSSPGILALWQQSTSGLSSAVRFHKPMAKIPVMTGYNHATGALNSLRMLGVDYAITSFASVGKSGLQGVNTGTLPAVAAGSTGFLHYTADTGW